jgi:phosphotransferase system HPr-like phosphotransfer protein
LSLHARAAAEAEQEIQALNAEVTTQRHRAGRAEGEAAAVQDALAHERARVAAVEAEREAIRAELAEWTAGGPIAQAVRAFLSRGAAVSVTLMIIAGLNLLSVAAAILVVCYRLRSARVHLPELESTSNAD